MRILFLTPRPPWPGRRGDQVRTSGLARELAARHEVHGLAQRWPGAAPSRDGLAGFEAVPVGRPALLAAGLRAAALGLSPLGAEPMQAALFRHRVFRRAARRAIRRLRPDVVVGVLSRLGAVLEDIAADPHGPPVVLDLVDALGANMRRRAARQRWLAPLLRREAARLDAWDVRLIMRSAAACVVAERDRRALLEGAPSLAERLAERIEVVPFGLDVPPELPPFAVTGTANGAAGTIVLTGNLGYFPTVDGALFFADAVWPAVRRRLPSARWILAGARPTAAIRALAGRDGIEVLVDPPDLGAVLAGADVAIAPLRAGSGTPIKILEAMAAGVAVLTTPDGRAGLDELPDGAVSVAPLTAASAGELVDRLAWLLAGGEARRRQAELAHRWLRRRHHLPRVARRFEALLERAVSDARRPGRR